MGTILARHFSPERIRRSQSFFLCLSLYLSVFLLWLDVRPNLQEPHFSSFPSITVCMGYIYDTYMMDDDDDVVTDTCHFMIHHIRRSFQRVFFFFLQLSSPRRAYHYPSQECFFTQRSGLFGPLFLLLLLLVFSLLYATAAVLIHFISFSFQSCIFCRW